MRERAVPGRLRRGEDAAHLQQGAVGDGPATGRTTGRTCSSSRSEGETMSVKPMNCPGHFLTVRERGAQLPRSADPLSRADAAAPQRGVGRALGADARAPVLAGRRALLRHAGADRRRGRAADSARAARLRRLRPAVHGEAVDAARRVPRRGRDLGLTPRRS